MLQFIGSQRVGPNLATELTEQTRKRIENALGGRPRLNRVVKESRPEKGHKAGTEE